jgi:ribosomal protein S18 acetylase RimI-like enzyme
MDETFQPLVVEGEPQLEDLEVLYAGLRDHHSNSGHPRHDEVFSIFLRQTSGEVAGGVIASTLWGRMYIRQLWVNPSLRGQGLGRKLMEAAETEALRRGCTDAHTDTFSWQAPEFYQSLGYKVFGKLENYPPGATAYYVTKRLVADSGA